MRYEGERPGVERGRAFWDAVTKLFGEAFKGLPEGIERASAAGARWPEMTTPFAAFEGDRCVAHVGVLRHPVRFGDEVVTFAGIHAVCTAEDRRGRGLCRELMRRAVAWAERDHAVMKLHTDLPAVYEGHGFRVTPTSRFRSTAAPTPGVRARRLTPSTSPADLARLRAALAARAPVSKVCASADEGWLVLTDAALSRCLDRAFWEVEGQDAIVAVLADQDEAVIADVIAPALPDAGVVAAVVEAAAPGRRRVYAVSPDRLEPGAEAFETPEEVGYLMVRGEWPGAAPFGVSPLWEH